MLDTVEHLDIVPDKYRNKAVVVQVGAPYPYHAAAVEPPTTGPLKVIFVGLYTPLQGTPVIGEALGRIAGSPIEVTMAGGGQDLAATMRAAAANDAVRWLDWVPAPELPALLAAHDVSLGIFGTSEKAMRVVPNKVFQGSSRYRRDHVRHRAATPGARRRRHPGTPGRPRGARERADPAGRRP